MKTLLVVTHMPSTNTRILADAVIKGACHEAIVGIAVKHLSVFDTDFQDVLTANAIILGTTENFGYMSGGMKDFFDRIYYPCLEKTQSLPYAMFIRGGNDGTGAQGSMQRIIKGLAWKQVQKPLICTGAWQPEFPAQCEELGMTMAAGLEAGIF